VHWADHKPVGQYGRGADESANQERNANSHGVSTLLVKPHPAAYQDGQLAESSQSGATACLKLASALPPSIVYCDAQVGRLPQSASPRGNGTREHTDIVQGDLAGMRLVAVLDQ